MPVIKQPGGGILLTIPEPNTVHAMFANSGEVVSWAKKQIEAFNAEAPSFAQLSRQVGLMHQTPAFQYDRDRYEHLAQVAAKSSPGAPISDELANELLQISSMIEGGAIFAAEAPTFSDVRALKGVDPEAYIIAVRLGDDAAMKPYRLSVLGGGSGLNPKSVARAATVRFPSKLSDTAVRELIEERGAWRTDRDKIVEAVADLKKRNEEIASLQQIYREGLRLHAAVKYWRDRAGLAKKAAWLSFIAFLLLVGIYLIAIAEFIAPLVENIQGNGALVEIALVTLPSLAFFWIMKLVARIYVQSVSRNADASERETLIQSYLALCVDTNTQPSPEERLVLIRAICRPGPGDQLDEAPQDAILDQLLKSARQ